MNTLPIDLESLYRPHQSLFDRYATLLIKWNQKINLTSIVDPGKIHELHFLDSLAVAALLPACVSRETSAGTESALQVLDMGAGAGFPGIPLKIVRPDIRLTLIESTKKKCDFMKEVVRSLALTDIEVVQQRLSEKFSLGQFDVVVSRAAFKMIDMLRYARPNLRPGGCVIGMKGTGIDAEIAECEHVLGLNHLLPMQEYLYTLPSGQVRSLVVTRSLV